MTPRELSFHNATIARQTPHLLKKSSIGPLIRLTPKNITRALISCVAHAQSDANPPPGTPTSQGGDRKWATPLQWSPPCEERVPGGSVGTGFACVQPNREATLKKGLDILHGRKSLRIIGIDRGQVRTAAEFWARYEKGEFTK